MKKVVKTEVKKLLDTGVIYPIFWQCLDESCLGGTQERGNDDGLKWKEWIDSNQDSLM